MKETAPQHTEELTTRETLVPELNKNGFVILENNDSFLGRIGKLFADRVSPTAKRVAIPVSAVLLTIAVAACSKGEASVNNVEVSYLPTPTLMSQVDGHEPIRRTSAPARITKDSEINLPKELKIPEGTRIVIGVCASDGKCMPNHNFYWGPTEEIVLHEGERENILLHEACHAHQDWSIKNDKNNLQDDLTLKAWYETAEGQSFSKAIEGLSWPWNDKSPRNGIEDFANTCAFYFFDPLYLEKTSPERYEWAIKNLPQPEPTR